MIGSLSLETMQAKEEFSQKLLSWLTLTTYIYICLLEHIYVFKCVACVFGASTGQKSVFDLPV